MSIFYILGNGFDLHYGLKTRTTDFKRALSEQQIYNTREDASLVFSEYGVNWSDFEEGLANISLEEIEMQNLSYPDYFSDHEYDRDGCIFTVQEHVDSLKRAIDAAMRVMVQEAERQLDNVINNAKGIRINKSDAILTFNYTTSAERLIYSPCNNPIYHIHGCLKSGDDLILGYCKATTSYYLNRFDMDNDYYVNEQIQSIDNFYNGLRKNYQCEKLKMFLSLINDAKEICVLGHSMSSVDEVYFDMIDSILKPINWKVYYHGEDDVVLTNIDNYQFKNKVSLFPW